MIKLSNHLRIKKTNILYMDDVYDLCRDERLYTAGTNHEYKKMLEFVKTHGYNPTDDDIVKIAIDIAKHSNHSGYLDDFEDLLQAIYNLVEVVVEVTNI